jgi:hypothetical protein
LLFFTSDVKAADIYKERSQKQNLRLMIALVINACKINKKDKHFKIHEKAFSKAYVQYKENPISTPPPLVYCTVYYTY